MFDSQFGGDNVRHIVSVLILALAVMPATALDMYSYYFPLVDNTGVRDITQ
jgi:hypothetical protein